MSDSLTEHDLALFAKLGIPKELLERAGVIRVTDAQAREDYGIRGAGDMAGVAFIYFDPATMVDGSRHRHYVRIRRDHPEVEDGREKKKYVAPYSDKKHFYFPPTPKLFTDVSVPIVLVEGEKSVLAVTAWCERTGTRLLPLAMGGCWNWRGQVGIQTTANGERVPEHGPILDLNICRDGRKTYVLLDANCSTNPKVGQARKELVRQLRKQKADVVALDLPSGHGNGPDDFVSSAGDAALVGLLEKGESTKSQHSAVIETTEQVFSDEGGRKTTWLSPPFVPKGGLVQLIGKIKIAGKTSFMLAMVRAILTGEPFLGQPTQRTGVVYLTEQARSSLRESLRRADLAEQPRLSILRWGKAMSMSMSWAEIMEAAIERAERTGSGLIVVDTLAQFSQLVGDAENNAGCAQEVLHPMQDATERGIAVVAVMHERKGGGDLADAARGSSAYGAGMDIVIILRRPEGNHPQTFRKLEGISRFDETTWTLIIERRADGSYVSHGDADAASLHEARQKVTATLPVSEGDALTADELAKAASAPRSTVRRVLIEFIESDFVVRVGTGKRKDPFRYYRSPSLGADNTPSDSNKDAGLELKSEAPKDKKNSYII